MAKLVSKKPSSRTPAKAAAQLGNCRIGSLSEKKRTYKRFLTDIDPILPCAKLTKAMVVDHFDKIARTFSGDRANRTRNHLLEAWS